MLIKTSVLKSWGPGGWMFYQPETDWHAPLPLANSFDKQVANIIKMREANPRFNLKTDVESVSLELEEYTLARWKSVYSFAGLQKFLENPVEAKKKGNTSSALRQSVQKAVAALAGADLDAAVEWLGEGGKAVPLSTATQRAMVCQKCPGNNRSIDLLSMLSAPAAAALRVYLSVKNKMSLKTPLDSELGVCDGCKCQLTLKVWAQLTNIVNNTKPETASKLAAYNPNCWVLTEK